MLWRAVLAACAALFWAVAPVEAQQLGIARTEILTISPERLFLESAFGKRIVQEIEEDSAALATENRRIEMELTAEEKSLTEQRETMEPQVFRELADAFDDKVQEFRVTQDAKTRALGQRREEARTVFLEATIPVLAQLMRETGASVILERSTVFLSTNATDITDIALQRIDAAIGDGSKLPLSPRP
ncbi:MAG: OmpH family outer membrane protein [Arenibacterium sp.]